MPMPTARDVHVDPLLTDYAIGYGQKMTAFAGDKGATVVRKPKQSAKYAVWSKADFYRSEMIKVADGAAAPTGGFRVTTSDSYFADVYGLKTMLTDRTRSNSDLNVEKAKVRWLVQQAKLKREKLWAAACFATGLWTSNTEQTGKSSNPSTNEFLQFNDESSVPLDVIHNQLLAVELSTGFMPNKLITNSKVALALRRHPDILDLYKHTSGGLASIEEVAEAFGVTEIVVGHAVENTGKEGQSVSMGRVFGNHILLAYISDAPGDEEPTAVTGFAWSEYDKVDATGVAIRKWRENDPAGDWFHAEQAIAYAITANDCGVFLLDAVA